MSNLSVYEKKIVINSRDVDGAGHCKASALLGYLQDASAEHTMLCGCGRKEMVERYNVFWMLTRIEVQLEQPIRWLDEVTIKTSHRSARGILLYRDYELSVNGRYVGAACALWVLPDLQTRKLLNVSQTPIAELNDYAGGLEPKIRKLTALHTPEDLTFIEDRLMRYSDTDVNAHINNTKYADFACDALDLAHRPNNTFVSEIEITYHEECQPGERIRISTAHMPTDWYVHGEGQDQVSRFDVRLRMNADHSGVTYAK